MRIEVFDATRAIFAIVAGSARRTHRERGWSRRFAIDWMGYAFQPPKSAPSFKQLSLEGESERIGDS